MRNQVIKKILEEKIIAIIRGIYNDDALNLVNALFKGGISLVEMTFQQSNPETYRDTIRSISTINDYFKGDVIVGAGTVLNVEQVNMAASVGAKYILSPNTDENVINRTRELGLVSIPGAMSPTEIVCAHNYGADIVKVFPANELGCGYIKAIHTPISHIYLMAVGGINEKNARSFIDAGAIGVGVGSSLFNTNYMKMKKYDNIANIAKLLVDNIR